MLILGLVVLWFIWWFARLCVLGWVCCLLSMRLVCWSCDVSCSFGLIV